MIDAPCGAGKTSWAIQTIKEHPDDSYIYCTPYLDEISRIRDECGRERFKEPQPYTGTKLDDFNSLLASGADIATTHTTFLNSNSETLDLIRMGDYTLIVDEVLDVVQDFNKVQPVESTTRQTITREDVRFLIERNIIRIEPDQSVTWCAGEYGEDLKFSAVQRYAKAGRLYCVNGSLLLAVFPPDMFRSFKQAYIMAYQFQGSIFDYYLQMYGIDYNLASVVMNHGRYTLTDYSREAEAGFRRHCKELIHICDNAAMNDYRGNALCKTWYVDNRNSEMIEQLKRNLCNYYRRYIKGARASSGDIMWTTYNDYEGKLKGCGYTKQRSMTEQEKALPQSQRESIEKEISCFVPCNSRATNIYRNRWALAYCVNMHINPMIRHFFIDTNPDRTQKGLPPIHLDENAYALSSLIQWIFRSRIRDGKPIEIYIPSTRMRKLLMDWMDCKI